MHPQQRKLALDIIGKARESVRIMLKDPLAERLRGKERISILDFGCGNATSTLGTAEAVADVIKPRIIEMVGINADNDNGGPQEFSTMFDTTFAHVTIIEPYPVYHPTELTLISHLVNVDELDLITFFNPSPPDRLMELVLGSEDIILTQTLGSRAEGVLKQLQAMTGVRGNEMTEAECMAMFTDALVTTMGVDPSRLEGLSLKQLKELTKVLSLELPVSRVFPDFIKDDGILFIASDDLILPGETARILRESNFEVHMQRENEPENVFSPSPITFYNKNLFAATLKR